MIFDSEDVRDTAGLEIYDAMASSQECWKDVWEIRRFMANFS